MPKLTCQFQQDVWGDWVLTFTKISKELGISLGEFSKHSSREKARNKWWTMLTSMQPGKEFIITTEWEEK